MRVSVNQVEGFDGLSNNAGCYLSVDGDFVDVITPISKSSAECFTDMPTEGLLRLILKNMRSGEVIGSVSIHIAKLKPGRFWLPLFEDVEDDLVQGFPVIVDPPRIEVAIAVDAVESAPNPLDNLALEDNRMESLRKEYDLALKRAEDRDCKALQKIKELADSQIQLQIEINRLNHSNEEKDLQIVYYQERLQKLSIETYEADFIKYKTEAENYSKEIDALRKQIKSLEHIIEDSQELAISLSSIKTNVCSFHEEETQRLQQQVFNLKQTIVELQKGQEKKSSDKLELELIKQIKELDEKLEFSEMSKNEMSLELADLKQEVLSQERLINELRGFIEGSRTERISLRDDRARSPKSRRKDSIDRSLEEYHAGQGIKNNFVKFSRGLYEFGSRKVNVSMKNGTIICRVGGGYVQIDDFLNIYMSTLSGSPRKNSRGHSNSPVRGTKNSFSFLESTSGKQTPALDSVFDNESLLTYSCDSEDEKTRNKTSTTRRYNA